MVSFFCVFIQASLSLEFPFLFICLQVIYSTFNNQLHHELLLGVRCLYWYFLVHVSLIALHKLYYNY